MTRRVHVLVHEMAHPEDCSGLARDLELGSLRADSIRAVFIKTEGNGLDNDWSRPLALRSLATHLPAPPAADARGPMYVVSGGCEGILTPHMVIFACVDDATPELEREGTSTTEALALGTAVSEPLDAAQIGYEAHALSAREVVERARQDAGLDESEVAYVHLLSPWMSAELASSAPPDATLVARTAHASKPAVRAAAALGAGLALNEIEWSDIRWTSAGPVASRHTKRVAVTAGDTGGRIHALVLGNSTAWRGTLQVASTQMSDMLDLQALAAVRHGRLLAGFFKGDPPADGRVRGARTTMGSDSDIHAFRHFRAAMSGVFGAALGSPRIFIGGGAEYQCIPGGGMLATVFETSASLMRLSTRHDT